MKSIYKDYESPLRIPEGKSGSFAISHKLHPPDKPQTVVSMRTAMFTGDRPMNITFPYPVRQHYLKENGDTWMSDIPAEIYQHKSIIKKLHGNVLIGGLGLGYVATLTAKNKKVNRVTVIEKSEDVIKLVWKHLKLSNGEVICADLFSFLKTTDRVFDSAYYDIWAGDGEATFYETVVPLRIDSRGKVPDSELYCWQEDVMRGQLFRSIVMQIQLNLNEIRKMPEQQFDRNYAKDCLYTMAQRDFFLWVRKEDPSQQMALLKAKEYVTNFGRIKYEKLLCTK